LQNDLGSSFVERGMPLNIANVKNSFRKQKIKLMNYCKIFKEMKLIKDGRSMMMQQHLKVKDKTRKKMKIFDFLQGND
jgi:hypothetical protein